MSSYTKCHHTVDHYSYHLLWVTKYGYKVVTGDLRLGVRKLIAQVAEELGVQIVSGVGSAHIHFSVGIPPDVSVSEFVKRIKDCSSSEIQLTLKTICLDQDLRKTTQK